MWVGRSHGWYRQLWKISPLVGFNPWTVTADIKGINLFISVHKSTNHMHLILYKLYLGSCAADAGMFGWGKEAVVADVGTTVVEGWVGYLYQASQHLMKGHYSAGLNPVLTETGQALLHSLRPARTDNYNRNRLHTCLYTQSWND